MDPANTELAMMPTVKNRREDKAVILRLHLIGYSSQSNFKLIVESFLGSHLFFFLTTPFDWFRSSRLSEKRRKV